MGLPTPIAETPATLVEALRIYAEQRKDRLAVTFLHDGETIAQQLTYFDLDMRARAVAGRLQRITTPGERALLLFEGNAEFIVAFLGCLYAQIVAVPAYPPRSNHHLKRLQALVEDSQSTLVLLAPSIKEHLGDSTAALLPSLDSARWVVLGDEDASLADAWQMPRLTPEAVAFLQYTSGSTWTPKGVMVSHGNLTHNGHLIAQAFSHSDTSTLVGWLPLFHDMGLIGNVLQPLSLGASCVLMAPAAFIQKPVRWLQAIAWFGQRQRHQRCTQLRLRSVRSNHRGQRLARARSEWLASRLQWRRASTCRRAGCLRRPLRVLRIPPHLAVSLLRNGGGDPPHFQQAPHLGAGASFPNTSGPCFTSGADRPRMI